MSKRIESPNSTDSESVILGACMNEAMLSGTNETAVKVVSMLNSSHFYNLGHRSVFHAIQSCLTLGVPPSVPLVADELKREGQLEVVGGWTALMEMTVGLPLGMDLRHYFRSVRETATQRDLIQFADRVGNHAQNSGDSIETIIGQVEEQLFKIKLEAQLEAEVTARPYTDVARSVVETFDLWQSGEQVAIPTQIPELDGRLNYGGLASGDLIVIAARTSFGKSALALQIALNTARSGVPVLMFSLEMSAERLFMRNLASVSEIEHYRISPHTFQNNPGLADRIRSHVPEIAKLPIRVDHKTRKLGRLLAVAQDWRRATDENKKRGLIITDYMQLVDNKMSQRSRNDEVAGISIALKGLATDLDVPLIGVSQFSRANAKENRRPELSDLRESGQLEQDCDLALFPYSKDGLKDDQIRSMLLYCPKQRGGQTGWEIPIDFHGDRQWFMTPQMYAQEGGDVTPQIDWND